MKIWLALVFRPFSRVDEIIQKAGKISVTDQNASLFQVIITDYAVFTSLLIPVIGLVVIIVTGGGGAMFLGLLAIVAAAALIIAVVRYFRILTFFNENQTAEAIIGQVYFYRDRGTVYFEFTYQGIKYGAKQYVMRNKRTTQLQTGEQVTVLVDRNDPRKAIIRKLFI